MINMKVSTESRMQAQRSDAAAGMNKLFLSEALKLMGPLTSSGSFSGGAAEEQFSSFLIDAYAETAAKKIDLGFI